ncbi:MAG: DUF5320 domain-containing protein [Actinobacteria bacterium]|nr:DUF5320 domain-containing protein [Actinomycetota bacterium]
MPRGDRTGPQGMGPLTGRGMGLCAGYAVPGYAHENPGAWGAGRDWGGRGRRNRFSATGLTGWQRAERGMRAWGGEDPAEQRPLGRRAQIARLRAQAAQLEQQLGALRDAMECLETD